MQRVGVLALCEVSDSVDVIETGIEFVEKRQELSSRSLLPCEEFLLVRAHLYMGKYAR